MSAREVVRRYFSGSDYRCDDFINTLTAAGYTIVRKDEVREAVLEEAEKVADALVQIDNPGEYNQGLLDAVDAIRSLKPKSSNSQVLKEGKV